MDIVTSVDLEISRYLLREKERVFGNRVLLLSEESSNWFRYAPGERRPVMVVDELDGTGPYSLGSPDFAHLFALAEHDGRKHIVTVGLINRPTINTVYAATADTDPVREVYHSHGHTERIPLHVTSEPFLLGKTRMKLHASPRMAAEYRGHHPHVIAALEHLARRNTSDAQQSTSVASLGVMNVADGVTDVFGIGMGANWDYAAPSLILWKAGGRAYILKEDGQLDRATPWSLQLDNPAGYYPALFTNGVVDRKLFEELRKNGKLD